mgnify:CR=1 FL=1
MAVNVAATVGETVVLLTVQLAELPAVIAEAVIEYPVGKPPCKTSVLPTVWQSKTVAPLLVVILRAA